MASAYRSALKVAEEHGCRIITFPAISTGIFGSPLHVAMDIAVKTIRDSLAGRGTVQRAFFGCFSEEVLESYRYSASGFDI